MEHEKTLFLNKVATWFLRVLTCANCIAANRLPRKIRSHRSEVSHGSYKDDVLLPSCLLLRARLIVLIITYSVSGSVDRNMTFTALFFLGADYLTIEDGYRAILRKVVRKSTRDNPGRYCRWF